MSKIAGFSPWHQGAILVLSFEPQADSCRGTWLTKKGARRNTPGHKRVTLSFRLMHDAVLKCTKTEILFQLPDHGIYIYMYMYIYMNFWVHFLKHIKPKRYPNNSPAVSQRIDAQPSLGGKW